MYETRHRMNRTGEVQSSDVEEDSVRVVGRSTVPAQPAGRTKSCSGSSEVMVEVGRRDAKLSEGFIATRPHGRVLQNAFEAVGRCRLIGSWIFLASINIVNRN